MGPDPPSTDQKKAKLKLGGGFKYFVFSRLFGLVATKLRSKKRSRLEFASVLRVLRMLTVDALVPSKKLESLGLKWPHGEDKLHP